MAEHARSKVPQRDFYCHFTGIERIIIFHRDGRKVIVFHVLSSFFMSVPQNRYFSQPVSIFHESWLPAPAIPAGYAALIDAHGLQVPLPYRLSAVSQQNKSAESADWRI